MFFSPSDVQVCTHEAFPIPVPSHPLISSCQRLSLFPPSVPVLRTDPRLPPFFPLIFLGCSKSFFFEPTPSASKSAALIVFLNPKQDVFALVFFNYHHFFSFSLPLWEAQLVLAPTLIRLHNLRRCGCCPFSSFPTFIVSSASGYCFPLSSKKVF